MAALRRRVRESAVTLPELLQHYEITDHSLISATAALGQLSDDGELMRAIAALVGVLEIKERASQGARGAELRVHGEHVPSWNL